MAKILKGPPRKKAGDNKGKPEVIGSGVPNMGDYWGEWATPVGGNSPAKDFLEPGKDFPTALFRSVIPDEETEAAIIQFWTWCDRYDVKVGKQIILNKLAAMAARFGRARQDALFGTINMLSPDMSNQTAWYLDQKERTGNIKAYSNNPKEKRESDNSDEDDI